MHADSPLRSHTHFQHSSVANPEKNVPRSVLKNIPQNIPYSGNRNGGRGWNDENGATVEREKDKNNRFTELIEKEEMSRSLIKWRGDVSGGRGSAFSDIDFLDMKSPASFLCESAVKLNGKGNENGKEEGSGSSRRSNEESMDSIRLGLGMSSPILAPSSTLGSPDTSIHHLDDLNDINDTCNDNAAICDDLFESGGDDREENLGGSFLSQSQSHFGMAVKRKHGQITRSDSLNTENCSSDIHSESCTIIESDLQYIDREEEECSDERVREMERRRERDSERMVSHDNFLTLHSCRKIGLESVEEKEEVEFGVYCEDRITTRGRLRADSVR